MKTQRPVLTLLCASLLSAFAAQAIADSGTQSTTSTTTTTSTEANRLAARYATFAGSESNAEALVNALRNGTSATLDTTTTTTTTVTNSNGTTSTTPTTFQPATGKMGWGNVNLALALAQHELKQMGIAQPTADQINAVLNGGSVTPTNGSAQSVQGVLTLRAKGEGWGQIAHTLGFKLGDVVSPSSNSHSQTGVVYGNKPEVASSHPNTADRPDHPQHPDHPDRPQRPDHPDHVGRPGG